MKCFLRDVGIFLGDYGLPIVVALLVWGTMAVVGIGLADTVKQVVTDIHTIAESVEKSD